MLDPWEGVSAAGLILTGARRDRVPAVFEPVLSAAASGLPDDVTLAVYGSVATGTARVGTSDVDLLSVGLPSGRAAALGARLSERFGNLCRGVQVAAVRREDVDGTVGSDETYGNQVFLRHYCVRLHGPDVSAQVPDAPADARAARGFNGDLGRHLDRWRRSSGDQLPDLGRQVGRKTLLAVAGLVSVHDGGAGRGRRGDGRPA